MHSDVATVADILIVDDTPDNLRLLSAMLMQYGYDVRSVTNGPTALMGIQAQPPDLLLLDITMPSMSGYEVCESLKSNPETREIPVIFISALNEVFDKVKAFSVGGVDYITKPFQVEEVIVRVKNQLMLRRLQTQLQDKNAQLQEAEAELRRSLDQERALNARIEELATQQERHRIAREMHDSLGHALVALNIQLESVLALWDAQPDRARSLLLEAQQLGAEAMQSVRAAVSEMRADPLQGQLLEGAIATLLQEFQRTTGITPDLQIHCTIPLSHSLNTTLYRIAQEGLTNICKHAGANAVQLRVSAAEDGILLLLEDNGQGFDTDATRSGFGLQGMRERVESVGGTLTIESSPNQGCCIRATLPRGLE